MSLTLSQVQVIFNNLATGNEGVFFTHVADDVDWTVEGTHPSTVVIIIRQIFWPTLSKSLPGFYREARNCTFSTRW